MSGGYLEYRQSDFENALEEIERAITHNGESLTDEEVVDRDPWFKGRENEITDEDRKVQNYSSETIDNLKLGYFYIKMASIFLNRIDYLFDGDDGEDSFNKRIEEDINQFTEEVVSKDFLHK